MSHEKLDLDNIKPAQEIGTKPVRGLQSKLITLTIIFVMLAEVLAFVPSVANTRLRWLEDRLNTAAAASIVFESQQVTELSAKVQSDTLMSTGTKAIILRKDGTSRIVASEEMPPAISASYDLDNTGPLAAIMDAFETLIWGGDRIIRVLGAVGESNDFQIELIISDDQLRHAMLIYSRNVLFISLIIAAITAGLLFFTINRLMLQPIRRLTWSMQNFSDNPEDATRIIKPDDGDDELWLAEQHLSAMQTQLHSTLRQQKRLADLGLAVSKINHDMRNILTSAQLISDRMANVDDPMVKRFAPKLLQTIDRAVGYSSEVLGYGRAQEAEPKRRVIKLAALTAEIKDVLSDDVQDDDIEIITKVPEELELHADSEQLFRVINNISRNAIQALKSDYDADPAIVKRLCLDAFIKDNAVCITIDDTGPGMPARAKEHLFKPFQGSTRAGGTGLGLAIARELVQAHGGDIILAEKSTPGTRFEITIPHSAS
ncbi:MAG: HAMP domain-containing histidine kinase [Rhizobiaceae bacterium]|nr:HAMP domain-containing histidine kinase [Rhizobiaceae bacterium]